jgi:uncharacterized protein YukE
MSNPLVAAKDTKTDVWDGVWIAQDIEQICAGVKSNDWVDITLGGIGLELDGLAAVSDPVSTLLQYGCAWLVEHVKPLTEALDFLAGDPAQIAANAQTWTNIAVELTKQSEDLARDVRNDIADWTGAAGDAYRARSLQQQQAITALAKGAESMAALTMGAGALIGTVRLLVRDTIAACIARLIVYAIEEDATVGFATPLVVEQATTTIAAFAGKIARYLKALIASLRKLLPIVRRLGELIDSLKRALGTLRPSDGTRLLRQAGDDGAQGLRQGIDHQGLMWNKGRLVASMDNVLKVAAKYGIDLKGFKFTINKIQRERDQGETFPTGRFILYVPAFNDDVELAKTLVHEMFHVGDLRRGIHFPKSPLETDRWEARAKAFEDRWWANHPLNPLNHL